MRLVLDTNILFTALINDSLTGELIIKDELQLYAPEFLLDEFAILSLISIFQTYFLKITKNKYKY